MSGGLVVVGGSVAATAFLERLRELDDRSPVTVIDLDPDAPYDRPPVSKHYLVGGEVEDIAVDWDDLDVRLIAAEAVGVNTGLRAVRVRDAEGDNLVPYDRLVIATGASPMRLPIEPADTAVLRSAADARRLREATADGRSVIIIGAGAIGVELASSLVERGSAVTLLDRAAGPLERLLAGHLAAETTSWLQDAGVDCRWGAGIERIERSERGWRVDLADGEILSADMVVSAVGARPAVGWLGDSELLADGVLLADESGRVVGPHGVVPDVYAIGDVVTRIVGDGRERTESWAAARQHGAALAEILCAAEPGAVPPPYFWTDVAGRRIQIVGALRPDARLEKVSESPERHSALYRVVDAEGGELGWLGVNAQPRIARILIGESVAV